jgi:hypothetical protein
MSDRPTDLAAQPEILLGRQQLGRPGAALFIACYGAWLALRLHI